MRISIHQQKSKKQKNVLLADSTNYNLHIASFTNWLLHTGKEENATDLHKTTETFQIWEKEKAGVWFKYEVQYTYSFPIFPVGWNLPTLHTGTRSRDLQSIAQRNLGKYIFLNSQTLSFL